MGIDIAQHDNGAPSEGRHIYRSIDGGFTFKAVVKQTASVTRRNGPVMVAHPTKNNVLFGSGSVWVVAQAHCACRGDVGA